MLKKRCYDIGGDDIGGDDIGGFLATLEVCDIGGYDIGGLATLEVYKITYNLAEYSVLTLTTILRWL